MTTLRRELRTTFREVLLKYATGPVKYEVAEAMLDELADAALEVAGIAKREKFSNASWDLLHGKPVSEESRKAAEVVEGMKSVTDRLEAGLKLGEFPQTVAAQSVYKWILAREKEGQSLSKFIEYVMGDPKRKEFAFVYHRTPENIKRDWPRAQGGPRAQTDEFDPFASLRRSMELKQKEAE